MKLAKLQEARSTIRFSAKLLRPKATEKIGSSALLTLPKSASAKLPSRGLTMVEGTINGIPFRAAQPGNRKRAGAGSRKPAICWPPENDDYVVSPASSG